MYYFPKFTFFPKITMKIPMKIPMFIKYKFHFCVVLFSIIFFVGFHEETFSQTEVIRSLNFADYEKTSFIPITEIEKIPVEIAMFSTIPHNENLYSIGHDSCVFVEIQKRIKKSLQEKFVPDILFIKNNTKLYQLEQESQKIDTSFTLFEAEKIKILVVCNAKERGYATIIFFLKTGTFDLKQEKLLSKQIINLCYNKQHKNNIINSPKDDIVKTEIFDDFKLPKIFNYSENFCLASPKFLPEEIPPALFIFPHEWFNHCKKVDRIDKAEEQERNIRQRLLEERIQSCKELIATENGRIELLGLLTEKIDKEIFGIDTMRYKEFHELPYKALQEYYSNYKDEKAEELARYSAWSPEKITPVEAEALRKLLQSDDKSVLEFA